MNKVLFQQKLPSSRELARLPYVAPELVELGDLRDLTLGASPGAGDSGGPTTFKCPGCP